MKFRQKDRERQKSESYTVRTSALQASGKGIPYFKSAKQGHQVPVLWAWAADITGKELCS